MLYISIFDGPCFFNYLSEKRNDLTKYKTEFDQLLNDLKKIIQSENKIYKQKILLQRLDRSYDDTRCYGPIKPKINKYNSTFSLCPHSPRYMNFAFEKLKDIVSQSNLSVLFNLFKALNETEKIFEKSRLIWYEFLQNNKVYDDYEFCKQDFENAALNFLRELVQLKRKLMKKSQSMISEAENVLRIQYGIYEDSSLFNQKKNTVNLIKVCELRQTYPELFVQIDSLNMISSEYIIKELDQFQSQSVFHGYAFLSSTNSLIYMNINSDRELSIYNHMDSDKNKNYFIENIESQSQQPDEKCFDFHLVDVNDYSHIEMVPFTMISTSQAKKLNRVIRHGYINHSTDSIYHQRFTAFFESPNRRESSLFTKKKLLSLDSNQNESNLVSGRLKSQTTKPLTKDPTNSKILTESLHKNNHKAQTQIPNKNTLMDLHKTEKSKENKEKDITNLEFSDEPITKQDTEKSDDLILKNKSLDEIERNITLSLESSFDNQNSKTQSSNNQSDISDQSMSLKDFDIDIVYVEQKSPKKGPKILDNFKLKKSKNISIDSFLTNKSYGFSIQLISDLFQILSNDLSFLDSNLDLNMPKIEFKKVTKKQISKLDSKQAYEYLLTILTVKTKPILLNFEIKNHKISVQKLKSFYEELENSSKFTINQVFFTFDICNIDLGRVCLSNWMTVNYIGALLFQQMDEMIESPIDENFRTRLHILEILYEFYQNENKKINTQDIESPKSKDESGNTLKKPLSLGDIVAKQATGITAKLKEFKSQNTFDSKIGPEIPKKVPELDNKTPSPKNVSELQKKFMKLGKPNSSPRTLPELPKKALERTDSKISSRELPELPKKVLERTDSKISSRDLPELPRKVPERTDSKISSEDLPELPRKISERKVSKISTKYLPETPKDVSGCKDSKNSSEDLPELPKQVSEHKDSINSTKSHPETPKYISERRDSKISSKDLPELPEKVSESRESKISLKALPELPIEHKEQIDSEICSKPEQLPAQPVESPKKKLSEHKKTLSLDINRDFSSSVKISRTKSVYTEIEVNRFFGEERVISLHFNNTKDESQPDNDKSIMDEIAKLVTEIETAAETGPFSEDPEKKQIGSEEEKLNEEATEIIAEIVNEFADFTNESTQMMGGINKSRPRAPGKLRKPKPKVQDSGVFSTITDKKLEILDVKSPIPSTSNNSKNPTESASKSNTSDMGSKQGGMKLDQLTNVMNKIKTTPKANKSDSKEKLSTKNPVENTESPCVGTKPPKSKKESKNSEEKESATSRFGSTILNFFKPKSSKETKVEPLTEDTKTRNSQISSKADQKPAPKNDENKPKSSDEKSENSDQNSQIFGKSALKPIKKDEDNKSKVIEEKSEMPDPSSQIFTKFALKPTKKDEEKSEMAEKDRNSQNFGQFTLKSTTKNEEKTKYLDETQENLDTTPNSQVFGQHILKSTIKAEENKTKSLDDKFEIPEETKPKISPPKSIPESLESENRPKFTPLTKTPNSSPKTPIFQKKIEKSPMSSSGENPKRKSSGEKMGKIDKASIGLPKLINEDYSDIKLPKMKSEDERFIVDRKKSVSPKEPAGKHLKLTRSLIGYPQPVTDEIGPKHSFKKFSSVDYDPSPSIKSEKSSYGYSPAKSNKIEKSTISEPQPVDISPAGMLPSITKQGLEYSKISNLRDHFQTSPPPISEIKSSISRKDSDSRRDLRSSNAENSSDDRSKSGKGLMNLWKK